jgi:hypothetical protein
VATTEIGMEIAMMNVGLNRRRNAKSTTIASHAPVTALSRTSASADSMNVDWSERTFSRMSCGRRAASGSDSRFGAPKPFDPSSVGAGARGT